MQPDNRRGHALVEVTLDRLQHRVSEARDVVGLSENRGAKRAGRVAAFRVFSDDEDEFASFAIVSDPGVNRTPSMRADELGPTTAPFRLRRDSGG